MWMIIKPIHGKNLIVGRIAAQAYALVHITIRSVVDDELEVRQLLQCYMYVQVFIKAK